MLHSLSWAPLLLDFGAVGAHDTSTLESWTIDGDYAFKNLGTAAKVHVVQDSDEMFLCSWGPLADRAFDLKPRFNHRFNWVNSLLKGRELNAAFYGPYFDPLKRRFFFLPVYWHANELNEKCREVERKAQKILSIYLGGSSGKIILNAKIPFHAEIPLSRAMINTYGLAMMALAPLGRTAHITWVLWLYRSTVAARLREVIGGDRCAWMRVFWRARQTAIYVATGQFIEEKPKHY